jgi:hypothetical protein
MAFHIHPWLRLREEVMEAEGLVQARDTQAVAVQKLKEAANPGLKTTIAGNAKVFFRGKLYLK